jgi:hypothetical protein
MEAKESMVGAREDGQASDTRNIETIRVINNRCEVRTQDGHCLVIVSGGALAQYALGDSMAESYAMVIHFRSHGFIRRVGEIELHRCLGGMRPSLTEKPRPKLRSKVRTRCGDCAAGSAAFGEHAAGGLVSVILPLL